MTDHVIAGGYVRTAAPSSSIPPGKRDMSLSNTGGLLVAQERGKYYEAALRGKLFSVSNQAVVTTTAGLATTWTGLAIANPAGSGHNLVIAKFHCAQVAVGAASAIGLMTGSGAAAGSLTPKNRLDGAGAVTVATASAGATIGTPVLVGVYGSIGSDATTDYSLLAAVSEDLDGSLIIPPGRFLATYTTAVNTNALVFSLMWEEVPIL